MVWFQHPYETEEKTSCHFSKSRRKQTHLCIDTGIVIYAQKQVHKNTHTFQSLAVSTGTFSVLSGFPWLSVWAECCLRHEQSSFQWQDSPGCSLSLGLITAWMQLEDGQWCIQWFKSLREFNIARQIQSKATEAVTLHLMLASACKYSREPTTCP